MKPMYPMLSVGIKTGNVIWDDLASSLGHVYDHACYDLELDRQRKQSDIVNLTIMGTHKEETIEFDNETFCESCFSKTRAEVELRVKGKEIYCPSCGLRRPLKNDS